MSSIPTFNLSFEDPLVFPTATPSNKVRYAAYFHCGITLFVSSLGLLKPSILLQEYENGESLSKDNGGRFVACSLAVNTMGRAFFGLLAIYSGNEKLLSTYLKANILTDFVYMGMAIFYRDHITKEQLMKALGICGFFSALQIYALYG